VYLYNVIVIGRTFQEHLLNLRKLFQLFQDARLKLNPENGQHFQKQVQYLGYFVSPEGVTIDPKKLTAIWEWPTPKNKNEIMDPY
jgi:hypothetical protein